MEEVKVYRVASFVDLKSHKPFSKELFFFFLYEISIHLKIFIKQIGGK